jgi:hypothetical protein
MTEKELLADVIELLNDRPELTWCHFPDSRKQQGITGFPDLVIVGPYGVMFRELKLKHKAKLEGNQVRWRYALTAARANYAVWTEQDLADGFIAAALDMIAYGSGCTHGPATMRDGKTLCYACNPSLIDSKAA